ncbi:ABC transporter, substrate-binding protein [Olsenella sp. DNF00959]|nr:ABC transporter, substrate-binding protein [Olsenella sp. DNF00959]
MALALTGCAEGANMRGSSSGGDKPVVYASFYPVADLTHQVVGDRMEVRTIIKGSQEPHDFELQAGDRAELGEADLVIYNGAGMEDFMDDLRGSEGDDGRFLDLSQGLTLLRGKDSDGDDRSSVNPHTWLSVRNAQHEVELIRDRASAMDPDGAGTYQANAQRLIDELHELDQSFQERLDKGKAGERYFVVSHAAFNYLAHDYGLRQVAVTGISPEDEPSAAQLATIADFVRQHGIDTIFFEGSATPKVAQTLARSTGATTSTLYTMENLSEEEMGLGYVELMRRNLDALAESFDV